MNLIDVRKAVLNFRHWNALLIREVDNFFNVHLLMNEEY